MPAFSFRHIKDLYPLFWSKAIEFNEVVAAAIREYTEEVGGEKPSRNSGVIEMKHYANKVTMDIIGVAGLGRNINSLHNPDDELIKNFEEITAPTFEQVIYFAAYISLPKWLAENLPMRIARRRKITAANVRNISRDFVKEKKELIKLQSDDHKDILSILIKSNDFSDDMLVDQALTFLAAGCVTFSSPTKPLYSHPPATKPPPQPSPGHPTFSPRTPQSKTASATNSAPRSPQPHPRPRTSPQPSNPFPSSTPSATRFSASTQLCQ